MINKRDPAEWQAQVEQSPESAPYVVRILLARLQTLDEENERLRNTNLELRHKIDTKAYQNEVNELKRELKAIARLVRGDFAGGLAQPILLVWSKMGDLLAVDLRKVKRGESVELPPSWQDESVWRLTATSAHDEILVVTKTGNSVVFAIEDLLKVSEKSKDWHQIPGLRLARDEFIAFITPIARLPLSDGLITIGAKGTGRKLSRWTLDSAMQSGQIGKGVRDENDWQAFGEMPLDAKANALVITRGGIAVRFPIEGLQPNANPAMKVEWDDAVIGVMLDDTARQQVVMIDTQGRGLRREIEGIAVANAGTKGKPIITTEGLAGVVLADEGDQIAMLMGGSTSLRVELVGVEGIPVADRVKAPSVAVVDGGVIGVAAVRVGDN